MKFLKRRSFVSGSAGALAGLAASGGVGFSQQLPGLTVRSRSRVFESQALHADILHLITLADRTLTLFKDQDQNQFWASAFLLDGTRLWQHQVPLAFSYSAIGTAGGGRTILLHALNLRLPDKKMIGSCLLALDPATGSSNVVQDLTGTLTSTLYFAGDGKFFGIGDGAL